MNHDNLNSVISKGFWTLRFQEETLLNGWYGDEGVVIFDDLIHTE